MHKKAINQENKGGKCQKINEKNAPIAKEIKEFLANIEKII